MQCAETNDRRVFNKLEQRIQELRLNPELGEFKVIGFVESDELVGAALFTHWLEYDVTISIASFRARWAVREAMKYLAKAVFEVWGCKRLTAIVNASNAQGKRIAEFAGFKLEGVKRIGFNGEDDALIYGMLKGECKWL